MKINPYLHFSGDCEAALTFYADTLGAEILRLMRYKEAPMETSAAWGEKIMHATLKIGESTLMASDGPPDHAETPGGFTITINLDDPQQAETIFAALAQGGSVRMPLQKTFWARAFGMLTDRFGTPWMVNCE